MANYSVVLKAMCVVVVEADSEEEAMDYAISEADAGDYEFCEGEYEGAIDDADLDSQKRHANLVLD